MNWGVLLGFVGQLQVFILESSASGPRRETANKGFNLWEAEFPPCHVRPKHHLNPMYLPKYFLGGLEEHLGFLVTPCAGEDSFPGKQARPEGAETLSVFVSLGQSLAFP